MQKLLLFLPLVLLFCISSASARDSVMTLSIQDALKNGEVRAVLDNSIRMYWGGQSHSPVARRYGRYEKSQRTAIMSRSSQQACEWALAGALKTLQSRVLREGGNAIINIQSNIKNNIRSSSKNYDCLVGGMLAKVAITGDVVKLRSGSPSQPKAHKSLVKKPNPLVKAVQQALVDVGYDPGEVDGIAGDQTKMALLQYQKDTNLPESGKIDKVTLISLGLVSMDTNDSSFD